MNNHALVGYRRLKQKVIMLLARPYIRRELPGWGKIYQGLVGDFRSDAFWKDAPEMMMRGKLHGFDMHLNLSHWSDRNAYFLGRWYELETQLFMADVIAKDDTVVDIGANRGNFTLFASYLVGQSGRVISFEPNPVVRALLERELDHNSIGNVTVVPMGLSNQKSKLVLNVPKHNSGEATFGNKFQSGEQPYVQVEAEVARGDDILAESRPAFVKIDVEGFEVSVIEGLKESLSRHKPIVLTEVISEHLKVCGTDVASLFSLFHGLGYQGYRLGLYRSKMQHHWSVKEADIKEDVYNAVWLHKDAPLKHRELFSQHLKFGEQKS